jgi:hypothetical protein
MSDAERRIIRLEAASRTLKVSTSAILEFLAKKGIAVENNLNFRLTEEELILLMKEFSDKEGAPGEPEKNI